MDTRLDWLISVDDHIIEPPDSWTTRVAAKYRDLIPHVEQVDGVDTWVYEHHRTVIPGIVVCAGADEFDPLPVNYSEMRRSFYISSHGLDHRVIQEGTSARPRIREAVAAGRSRDGEGRRLHEGAGR